jgi:hypothetical protein
MGDFWNRYKLDNGRLMSLRQIKRIEELEGIIEWKCALIKDSEIEIYKCIEKITQIKRGRKKKPVVVSDPPF